MIPARMKATNVGTKSVDIAAQRGRRIFVGEVGSMGERAKMRKKSNAGASPKRRRATPRKRPVQFGLVHAYRGRGGPRPGAGRKPAPGRRRVPHRRRRAVRRDRPLHVTVRLREGLPVLRRVRACEAVRRSIGSSHKANFRVVHFSVQTNHLHLVVEADDRRALSRGMQGLEIRLTRRLNGLWGTEGTIFAGRYHDREIATPKEARTVLLYVIANARKHAAQHGRTLAARWVDPCSSARQLDGWKQKVRLEPGIVQRPHTWMLRTGWKKHGLLDAHAVPASAPP
jgi:REP element-mobilizing transposase RayT